MGTDAVTFDPAGAAKPRSDPAAVTDYLYSSVESGDHVTLQRRDDEIGLIYDILHEDRWVGSMTPRFGEIIGRELGRKPPPSAIHGCRVESVATTALPSSVAEILGAPSQLVPTCRIHGVGKWS